MSNSDESKPEGKLFQFPGPGARSRMRQNLDSSGSLANDNDALRVTSRRPGVRDNMPRGSRAYDQFWADKHAVVREASVKPASRPRQVIDLRSRLPREIEKAPMKSAADEVNDFWGQRHVGSKDEVAPQQSEVVTVASGGIDFWDQRHSAP